MILFDGPAAPQSLNGPSETLSVLIYFARETHGISVFLWGDLIQSLGLWLSEICL